LAHQCPAIDGTVVYQARHLYSLVNETVITYNDYYCSQIGFSFGRENADSIDGYTSNELEQYLINYEKQSLKNSEKVKSTYQFNLFPNPAKNEVNITSFKNKERIIVQILDVNNRVLFEKEIEIINHISNLKLDLLNGIYFVYLIDNSNYREIKKLIISK
jgi:hypothetical protein